MAESIENVYKMCAAQHVAKQADQLCPECEEGLCKDCFKHHNASKYTRSNEVISIEDYSSLPSNEAKEVRQCEKHGQRYQLLCLEHDCLSCPDCLSERNSNVSEFVSSVKSLGTIMCSKSSTTVTFHTEKANEAQMVGQPQANRSKPIDEIDMRLVLNFSILGYQPRNSNITGCTVITDGKIILADDINGCLVVLHDEGKVEGQISLKPSRPWDVTSIHDSRVAVGCNFPHKILLVNIRSKTIEKTITIDNVCYGMQHRNGILFYNDSKIGLQTYNLTTSTRAAVVETGSVLPYARYVAVSSNRIYMTRREKHIVLCFSDTGDKIWEFCNREVINVPYGVAVDKYSNVYVASHANNSIVVISSDGKNFRKLTTLRNPMYAIHIDNNDRLLVVDRKGNVTIYKI